MIFLYIIVLVGLLIYSYALVDPNITIIAVPLWETFRNVMVQLGYHNRPLSWLIFLGLVSALFILHLAFIKTTKKFNPIKISIIIGTVLLLAYPFLSHDLFSYMFDARIVTYHGSNPYLYKPVDFPGDEWLRFMHWTHNSYAYGPTFLPLTLIPSFLSIGKFSIGFVLFKSMFVAFYIGATYFLAKINEKSAIFFATHPLIIIEGVVNNHNDLIAVSLAIIGVYYLVKERSVLAKVLLLISGGIKYLTLPLLLLQKPLKQTKFTTYLAFLGLIISLLIVILEKEIYPWYFLNLFVLLPYARRILENMHIFFFGLLISYYPFVFNGIFDSINGIPIQSLIIIVCAAINLLFYVIVKLNKSSIRD